MTDLAFAVQQAIFTKLSAAVTLAAVAQHLDENFTPPIALIGEDLITTVGGKGEQFERHELTINVITQGASKKELRSIQEQVRAALDSQAIAATGATLSKPAAQTMNDQLLPDGVTYVGAQQFLIFAQPG